MPYSIRVKSTFSAAHALRDYGGPCENVHGHNFNVELVIDVQELNKMGISVDFRVIDQILKNILEDIDHTNLNDTKWFTAINPTAENIARHIYELMTRHVVDLGGALRAVTVKESSKYAATFTPDL
jgi:6-pyruvoyltetrahydropterin/6-carboxytetrahydropterin synthase